MGVGAESVGGGDTWTLLLAPWGWVLKLQVVATLRREVLHHGGGPFTTLKLDLHREIKHFDFSQIECRMNPSINSASEVEIRIRNN